MQIGFGDEAGNFSGNLGVRYVHTDESIGGNSIDLDAGFTRDPATGELTENQIGAVTRSRTYDDFLPSINLRYDLGDDHVIRFGAARTISRPSPSELDLVVSGLSGAIGEENEISFNDPNLDPFRSDNLDLGWEWYYADEALFSVALFRKDLRSLIGPRTIIQNFDVTDGVSGVITNEPFTVTTNSNDTGVELRGYEVQLQQPFTFLPGFLQHTGFQGNYTYIDNSAPDRLRAAAEDNYNLIVYFDNQLLDVRVSYTYRGEYLFNPGVGVNPDELFSPRKFLAANVTYHINDKLQLFFNAANITDEPGNRFHRGGLVRQYQDFGQSFTIGINGQL